jgi:PAS domain S-box-containing protein
MNNKMILTDKSNNSKEYGTAWRDFMSAMLTFNSERTKSETLSGIIEGGLDVFLHFPGAGFSALFLFDQETAEFRYNMSVPAKEQKKINELFVLLIEELAVAEALESGNVVLWRLKNGDYKDEPVLIIPLVCSIGIIGVVILVCSGTEAQMEQLIIGLCKVHANQFASLIYNSKLVRKINSIQGALEQKIALRTKKIEQSERELKAVIDSVQTGIMIIDRENNRVIDANVAAQHIIGTAKEKLIGSKRRDICILPESEDYFTRGMMSKSGSLECVLTKDDGSLVPIIRTVSNVTVNDRNCYLISFMDITERKEAEKALKESEKHFRTIFEKAGSGMALTNLNGKIVEANNAFCEMIGYPEEELKFLSFSDFTHPEDRNAGAKDIFLEGSGSDSVYVMHVQKRLIHKTGRIVWGKITNTFIHSADGMPKHGLSMVEDITDQKISEEALIKAKESAEEASRIKSSLMANMSHELRTPMNGILGFSQILNEELIDPFLKDMNQKILTSGKRLMNTINSILDLSAFESSAPDIDISDYNMAAMFSSFSPLYEKIASEKKLGFRFIVEEPDIFVKADQHLLEQIINNLLDNAIKYTEKGEITVAISAKTEDDDTWGVFSVKDTGIGIANENYDFIFDAFRQVSEGIGRRYEGAGLGLTLVKKMVAALGGKIHVESELGKGSTFTVSIPGEVIRPLNSAREGASLLPNKFSRPGGKPKVLLVEDNAVNQDVAVIFLKDFCEIDHVEDGRGAIEMASIIKYDVILMDINLGPGINGIEAAQKIKEISGYEKTPLIAITGYAMAGDKERLLSLGLTHYLPKPYDKEQIIKILEEALEMKK